jgi:opacity protein-like surface antigen
MRLFATTLLTVTCLSAAAGAQGYYAQQHYQQAYYGQQQYQQQQQMAAPQYQQQPQMAAPQMYQQPAAVAQAYQQPAVAAAAPQQYNYSGQQQYGSYAPAPVAKKRDNWPNWYIGVHGEYSFVSDADLDVNGAGFGEIEFDDNFAAGAAVGFRPYYSDSILDYTRWELEYTYRAGDLDNFSGSGLNLPLDGSIDAHAFMANMYFDMKTDSAFSPYVGGGIGLVSYQADSTDLGLDESSSAFAYQGMVGVSYAPQALPDTEWNLGYRYFGSTDPEFTDSAGNNLEHDYSSHNIEAGARFRF